MITEMIQDPRLLAARILSTWTEIHDPPRIESRDAPEWQALSSRDRALAFELTCGVIRRRLTLDALVHAVSKTPLDNIEPDVMAVLRLGVYQLIVAQGIADHAAIATSVELVRHLGAVRAASFVNAVLRNIQRLDGVVQPLCAPDAFAFPLDDQRQIHFSKALFPDPQRQPVDHLAVTTSHPRELVTAMIQWIGMDKVRGVLIADNVPPVVTLRSDNPVFIPPPAARLVPHKSPQFFVAANGWNSTIEALISAGELSAQDPTAARAVRAMATVLPAESDRANTLRILDLCAGLGTKSLQMARTFPHADIIACDIAADKLLCVERRAKEVGVTNIRTMAPPTLHQQRRGIFDAVLVDAPCSNTGVMGRRLQVRWRWPLFVSGTVREVQTRLLDDAATFLKPDGVLTYSTCSIDPNENRAAVEHFLRSHPHEPWQVVRRESQLPVTGGADERCDGGFVTVFKRHRAG